MDDFVIGASPLFPSCFKVSPLNECGDEDEDPGAHIAENTSSQLDAAFFLRWIYVIYLEHLCQFSKMKSRTSETNNPFMGTMTGKKVSWRVFASETCGKSQRV